jgi:GT2 family glycosyltransferase
MNDSSPSKVFVIILNFNGKDSLSDCLRAVFQSDYPNFETIIIDNDSQDGSFEQAKLNFSKASFIKNAKNVGFSKGNNVGIRYALEKFADYVFILNNDAIIQKSTLSELITTAEKYPGAGIISPLILNADNKTIWFAGGIIDWLTMKTLHITSIFSDKPYFSQYISGCAMLIKKEVFKKIGLFDERFFLYYEDADFSLRTKKAGFNLIINPLIKIKHFEQSTKTTSKNYWLVLSGLLFFKTHATLLYKFWYMFYVPVRKAKNFYKKLFLNSSEVQNVSKAYSDFKKLPN